MNDDNYYLNSLREFRNNYMQQNKKYLPLLAEYDIIGPIISNRILNYKNKAKFELPSLNAAINKSPAINNIFSKNKLMNNNSNESPSTSAFTNSTKKNINGQNLTDS